MDPEVCPVCEKVVYDAEGFPAGGYRWHKRCFKCSGCSKRLSSNNVRVHAAKLYCKVCVDKIDPAEAPKIYTDTSKIAATDEKGCPRCGGAVFEAEKVTVKDDVYHKKCLTCTKCARALDSLALSVAPDNNIYCKVCYKVVTAAERPQVCTDTSQIQAEDEKDGCPRCGGKVFEAEKMTTKRGFYHKKCFTCGNCKRALDYQLCTEAPDNDIYCKLCYAHMFGHKSKPNLNTADVTAIQGEDGDANTCPRCQGVVFDAEKQVAKSGAYHKKCFTCAKCKHQLDATNFANGPDNDIYCVYCYRVTHGHKAMTKSMPLDTTSIMADAADKSRCPRCSGRVFAAEKMVAASGWYHKHCFRCSNHMCNQPLDSFSVCDGPDDKIYCRVCYGRLRTRSSSIPNMYKTDDDMLARATIETWVIKAEKGEQNCCPKCDGKVFEAEKMVTASGSWYHKNCFRCVDCSRLLDSLTNNDGPDGQLYCKGCYNLKFGPQVRSSDVDHKIIDTGLIKAEDPKKNCPRCGGAVFKAEAVPCKDRLYHKKCASCASCEKKLTFNTIFNGDDQDIYCEGCYHRKFAPSGYRGAGCASWVDNDSNNHLRHTYQAF